MVKKYVWLDDSEVERYAEFKDVFNFSGGKALLKITANYRYAAFINGKLVANSQFTDIPEYKTFSEYDVSDFLLEGNNEIIVKAYTMPKGCFQCRVMPACVAYEILENDKIIVCTSENTFCREEEHYSVADLFTLQIGNGYNYSFTKEEKEWKKCFVKTPNFVEVKKPIKNTFLTPLRSCDIIAQGVYKLSGGESVAQMMQNAWLKTLPFNEITYKSRDFSNKFPLSFSVKDDCDGIFILGDLGAECAGFPHFNIVCDKNITAYLGWGEHLNDLRIRTSISVRNFAIKIELKQGENDFSEYLRRIGGRYMCLYLHCKTGVTINSFGIYEELYPLAKPKKDFGDKLFNAVYETGRRTLELCMHEHYEDCPWREQALYGMDSRNQMLFGYGAFYEYEFPRASLSLIAKCIQEDGQIPICAPSENDLTIPSFSAYWVIAVLENVERDFNQSFLQEVIDGVEKVIYSFIKNTKQNKVFTFLDKRYWNFHEWSEGLDNWDFDFERKSIPDGALTALVFRATKSAIKLEKMLNRNSCVKIFENYLIELERGLYDFFDDNSGLFASYISNGDKFGLHEYTQTLFLLTDALKEREIQSIVSALKNGKADMVPITFAGLTLKYESLLKYANAIDYVLEDISKIFGGMLFKGATSYWETADGEKDFDNAGSLCHGWASVACYVLDNFVKNKI